MPGCPGFAGCRVVLEVAITASTSQPVKSQLGNLRGVFYSHATNLNNLLGDKLRHGIAAIFQT